jgi:hypothetical protein
MHSKIERLVLGLTGGCPACGQLIHLVDSGDHTTVEGARPPAPGEELKFEPGREVLLVCPCGFGFDEYGAQVPRRA